MFVLVVNNVKDGKTLRFKSHIVILGNFENISYQKSQRYDSVLNYSSLCLLTIRAFREKNILQQGDLKNEFCNETLPDDEVNVIHPPAGDPEFNTDENWILKKTLYVILCSPRHWYNMINGILLKIGLNNSPHDPFLLSGTLTQPYYATNSQHSTSQLHVGLYVDDFVFFYSNPFQ